MSGEIAREAMQFRYTPCLHWYKGNTHIHTILSDGGKTYAETAHLYASAGYNFLVATDHAIASDIAHNTSPFPLLWIDGIELDGDVDGHLFHIVGIGHFEGISPSMSLSQAIEAVQIQGGLIILAHPFWSGNTFTDTQRWAFNGIETYNHVCQWLNGKGDGKAYWNYLLSQPGGAGALGFAVDDAHLIPEHPGWDGGWIMVNATELTVGAITRAIRQGNFYSSCGPVFNSLSYDGEAVHFTCSPVQFVRLVGPSDHGDRIGSFSRETITSGKIRLPLDWPYIYLEIEDTLGRRAWTNPLFVPQFDRKPLD